MGTLAFEARTYRNGSPWGEQDYGGSASVRSTGPTGGDNYVMEIRLPLPVAVSDVSITLVPESANSTYDFYYSLQTSQNPAYYDVTGDSVARDGAIRFSRVQGTPEVITISESLDAGTYYVYVWSSMNTGFYVFTEILVDDTQNPHSSVSYTEAPVEPDDPPTPETSDFGYANVSGTFQTLVDGFVNVDGVWTELVDLYAKVSGVWKYSV